jgi:ABC-type sugar transport system substrate-binding protein
MRISNKKLGGALLLSSTALLAIGGLSACGSSKDIIAVSLPNQATSLNVGIGEKIKDIFEAKGYEVKVESADDSSTSQKAQLETFITMGVKMIVMAPVEMGTVEETLVKARAQGIKVVVNGVNSIADDAYDACTVSNEYLVGSYVALLAKHWVEAKYNTTSTFSTLIMRSSLAADPISRSKGMAAITDPYLKNTNGEYVDVNGNVTDEAHKVANPSYSKLVADHPVHEVMMGTADTGKALVQNALLDDANVRLVLMYGSLFAPGGSQYIVDNYGSKVDDFGIFGGGVSGNEAAYMLGSLPDGVDQSVTVGGDSYAGVKSVFRGAVSFGGEDAAGSVAQLASNCFFGTEGVDYQKKTPETLGLWFTYNTDKYEAVAVKDINTATVTDFDPTTTISDSATSIKWSHNK